MLCMQLCLQYSLVELVQCMTCHAADSLTVLHLKMSPSGAYVGAQFIIMSPCFASCDLRCHLDVDASK